eukprot:TCALIF_08734-PA protein Name:"Similar to TWISTNB DNA-directed RNA polymerase I subunit RPA43 (Homo sapiens)" AED:0.94 eAED:0.94 QI:0/0/0/0.33/1/1/3/0/321
MSQGPIGSLSRNPSSLTPTAKKVQMLPLKTLQKLEKEPDSGIWKCRQTLHVALHPRYLHNLQLGLVTYFNQKINIFDASPKGDIMNEEAHIHVDVVSDFWVFRPVLGAQLKGVVNKKSPTHVSCLVHGCFNVPCYRPPETPDWCGSTAKLDQVVRLTVQKVDLSQKIPFIMGTLQSESVAEHIMNDGSIFSQVEEVPSSTFKAIKRSTSDLEYDSGIDSLSKKRKRKLLEETVPETEVPEAEEAPSVNDETILASAPSPPKKRRKKAKKSKGLETKSEEVEEPEVDKEVEVKMEAMQNSLLEAISSKIKPKKKKKSKESAD